MKKIFICIAIVALFNSCSITETENVSKITNYPIVKVTGEKTIVINEGTTYTDQGAKSFAGTQQLTTKSSGSVDTSKAGVYKINYESFNDDGFSATAVRTVIVLKNTPSTINLEGVFVRNGTNVNIVTKISDRVYKCSNAGGLAGPYVPDDNRVSLIFYNIDDLKVYAPFQENTSPTGIGAETSVGNIISANQFNWILLATGVYGTAVRSFVRQ